MKLAEKILSQLDEGFKDVPSLISSMLKNAKPKPQIKKEDGEIGYVFDKKTNMKKISKDLLKAMVSNFGEVDSDSADMPGQIVYHITDTDDDSVTVDFEGNSVFVTEK